MPQLDLHEVIRDLLRRRPDGMTKREIAEVIEREGLFIGPRSGRSPSSGQISARVSNHRELFAVRDGRVYLL